MGFPQNGNVGLSGHLAPYYPRFLLRSCLYVLLSL